MKYLNKILLFSLLVFAFACDKEDEDDDGMMGGEDPNPITMTPEEIAEAEAEEAKETLSVEAGWTITAIESSFDVIADEIEANNLDETGFLILAFQIVDMRLEAIADCETDDVIKFADNFDITYNEGADTCTADGTTQYEVFFENGTWELKDANTITIMTSFEGENDTLDYNIDTLTDTDFVLSNSIDANDEAEIDVTEYQFTNTLDTKITMTRAN